MSIQIGRIIQVYQQCIAILQARGQLLISQTLNISPQSSTPPLYGRQPLYETYPQLVVDSLNTILKMWNKKIVMFKDLLISNQSCINDIEVKRNGLQNNTALLTKEEQLISEAQTSIKQWGQIRDPVIYYEIRRRKMLKEELLAKVNEIKSSSAKTKQSAAPMYLRKIQQQFKTIIYEVYLDSARIDSVAKTTAIQNWQNTLHKVYRQGNELNKVSLQRFVSSEKNDFSRRYYQLLSKKQKVSSQKFAEYCNWTSFSIKRVCMFWSGYVKMLRQLCSVIEQYLHGFHKDKQLLYTRQTNITKYLQKTGQTISLIFNIDSIVVLLVCQNQIFAIIALLQKLLIWVGNIKIQTELNEKTSEQYLRKIPKEMAHREKQFHLVCIEDKNFLQYQQKFEISMNKKMMQGYMQFLNACYNLCKDSIRRLSKGGPQMYEMHQIGGMLTKEIISVEDNSGKNRSFRKSQISMESTNYEIKNGIKNQKIEKLTQIQNFISQLQVFNCNEVDWSSVSYSCALGPKLLLTGRLIILSQGIYFQSFFNKRNFFFGKTKLFIPRGEILQTGTVSTLIIFPNAIEIKTSTGILYFHALQSLTKIYEDITQIYFPQNNKNEQDEQSQLYFKQFDKKQIEVYNQQQINQLLKPQEIHIADNVFHGISFAKFFRRYFSDDRFEIRGQIYENFKSYFLMQIETFDQKSTQLIPEPPSYFMYRNEGGNAKNYPKISQRYHTYKKTMPRIPFLLSGGDCLCQDRQIYHWISDKIFIVENINKVKGFSLVEGMQIITKTICEQYRQHEVKVSLSTSIKFSTESGANNLIKGPALNNLKQSIGVMMGIIEKYEKKKKSGKSGKGRKGDGKENNGNQEIQEKYQKLLTQNNKLQTIIKTLSILYLLLYILTLIIIFFLFQ